MIRAFTRHKNVERCMGSSPPENSNNHTRTEPTGLSFLGLVNVVLRRRAWVLWCVVGLEIILLVVALLRPLRYTTVTAFMPEGQRTSGVSSLAAQFGVNVANTDGLSSPQFYPELVRSPQFLGAVVDSTYTDASSPTKRSLIDIYGIAGADARVKRAGAVEKLAGNITVSVAPRTGIVTIGVTADRPELAQEIAARILSEITRFNQYTRQSRAAAEKRFVERRLSEVRDSLRIAEDRLERFLQGNRDFKTSPTIAFQHARLERAVESQQVLLATLAPSYEQAKIEEVRDTPVLTLLRRPEAPVYPDPRGRFRLMVVGLFGGLAIGVALVLAIEGWQHLRSSPGPEAQEFSTIAADINSSFRRKQLLRAVFGSREA
jgi:uncharacterized protein involved in exopolysaccharide biosynthesis